MPSDLPLAEGSHLVLIGDPKHTDGEISVGKGGRSLGSSSREWLDTVN